MNELNIILNFLPALFVLLLGIIALIVVITFFYDLLQNKNTILKNYPVVGHFRYLFITLGEFFRQYFFAMDREEMPFNRAERTWVNHAAADKDNTVAFGSTKNIALAGSYIFVNCPFPTLDSEAASSKPAPIGEYYCEKAYYPKSIFNISGMSYGALSKPAISALAQGAKLANCWINTGEGGLSPYHKKSGADIVFQIGTGKYGVRTKKGKLDENKLKQIAQLEQVKMFEVKVSQGAKPGKGGILPGLKVTDEIAEIRGIEPGVDSLSPNRLIEVKNAQQLLDFIAKVKEITNKPVGFKTVIGHTRWLDWILDEVNLRGMQYAPDFITVDGGDGGTGAAPMPLMDNVGLPLGEALPMVVDDLITHGLKQRIKVIASGKLITPIQVAWAFCAGADYVVSARGFMISIGCVQSLKCNKNTCPTGITTHNKRLQRGLNPQVKAEKVANYVKNIISSVETIAHSCGVDCPTNFNRSHVRIVGNNTRSFPMDEIYPYPR